MSNTMTIEDYTALLNAHDWNYALSEQASVYERGKRQKMYLVERAFSREDFMKLFLKYREARVGA